jgi:hypothetical protein
MFCGISLASASRKIIMSPSSEAGSIGVQASWTNMEGFWAKLGIQKVYFHSKYSDKKNLSPATKEGAAAEQKLLDETWDLFAGAICKHRGITVEELVEKYGQGEVFLAKEALERGLVDDIVDDFDACVELIKPQGNWGEGEGMAQEQITTVEALTAAYPELVASIKRDERKAGVDEGTKAERARAESLMSLSAHVKDIGVIAVGIKDGKTKEAVMTEILDAQPRRRRKPTRTHRPPLRRRQRHPPRTSYRREPLRLTGLLRMRKRRRRQSTPWQRTWRWLNEYHDQSRTVCLGRRLPDFGAEAGDCRGRSSGLHCPRQENQ